MAGRFAPSPTSDLHLGNLRTALVAWLLARAEGVPFIIRMEDLDQGRVRAAGQVGQRQLDDLAALGLMSDVPIVWQSGRLGLYRQALAQLPTYECFCTRREIAEAASAPHADGFRPYPGTCRDLTSSQRDQRRARRQPALRVSTGAVSITVTDRWAGEVTSGIDDFVLRRNDGAFAYNLAVVVDDLDQRVTQVVRGSDLLSSSPRQAWLARWLGGVEPEYAHVGLVTNWRGERLSKRCGAITLADLAASGTGPNEVLSILGASLDLNEPGEPVTLSRLQARFDPGNRPGAWSFPGGDSQDSDAVPASWRVHASS